MARPTKQGIDYFPLDCAFDDKIEMYLLEKEAVGLAVLVTIWQLIYSNEGYYIKDNNDLLLLVKKRINVDVNEIDTCKNSCLTRGIFNENLHNKYEILTSKATQKRYFDAARKKKIVTYDKNYIINGITVSKNAVNVAGNATNVKGDVDVDVKGEVKEEILTLSLHEMPLPDPEDEGLNDDNLRDIWRNRFGQFPLMAGLDLAKRLVNTFGLIKAKQIMYNLNKKGFNVVQTMEDALDWGTGEIKPKDRDNGKKTNASKGSVSSRLDYEFNPDEYEQDKKTFGSRF